jgi:hypothetical protein
MPSHRDYSPPDDNEYFQLTQFHRSTSRPISYDDIAKVEGEVSIYKFEITRAMAEKILRFIDDSNLNTRGEVRFMEADTQIHKFSYTVYTVRFSLHIVAGKRGGWYIIENSGQEPIIPNEFVEYGPKRKSGGRKNSYRRNLSFSEENEVRALKGRTPSIEQIYRWIVRKYPNEVLNLAWSGDGSPSPF